MDSENFSILEELTPLPHVIELILCYLDMETLKNTKLSGNFLKEHVEYLMRIPSLRNIFEKKILIEKWCLRKELPWRVLKSKTLVHHLQFIGSCEGFVLLGLSNGDVELWDVRSDRRTRMNEGSGLCNVDCNGSVIVGASDDSTVIVWDMEGRIIRRFFHHSSSVFCLVVTATMIITGSMTGEMSFISLESLEVVHFWSPHESQYGVLDLALDNDRLVSVGKDMKLWSLSTPQLLYQIETGPVTSISLAWPLAAMAMYRANHGACVQVWNIERREMVAKFGDHPVIFIHLDMTKLVVVELLTGQLKVMKDSLLKYFRSAKIVIQPAHWLSDTGSAGGHLRREIQLEYEGKLAIAVSGTGLVYSEGSSVKLVDFTLTSSHGSQL